MHDLNAIQRDLLYIIAGMNDPNGLGTKDELERYYGKKVWHGRLYRNLEALVAKGLVEKRRLDGRSNVYSLTPRGRREIEHRLKWERERVHGVVSGPAEPEP